MRYLALSDFTSLSTRFRVFDKSPGWDAGLLAAGLFPPLPVCDNDLIWGFPIVAAAEDAGLHELPVTDIPRDGSLLRALKLENRAGKYSWREQTAIYTLWKEQQENEDRDAISVAVSGNRGFFSRIDRYMHLPGHLATRVNEGRIDLGIAEKIAGIPKAACDIVFSPSALSFSQTRTFLVTLSEIQKRDALTGDQVIALTDELAASDDPVTALEKMRNPGLSDLTARFEAVKERYTQHTGVTLEAPKFFEGDAYTVSFSFSNAAELVRKRRILEKIEEVSDELEDLL